MVPKERHQHRRTPRPILCGLFMCMKNIANDINQPINQSPHHCPGSIAPTQLVHARANWPDGNDNFWPHPFGTNPLFGPAFTSICILPFGQPATGSWNWMNHRCPEKLALTYSQQAWVHKRCDKIPFISLMMWFHHFPGEWNGCVNQLTQMRLWGGMGRGYRGTEGVEEFNSPIS